MESTVHRVPRCLSPRPCCQDQRLLTWLFLVSYHFYLGRDNLVWTMCRLSWTATVLIPKTRMVSSPYRRLAEALRLNRAVQLLCPAMLFSPHEDTSKIIIVTKVNKPRILIEINCHILFLTLISKALDELLHTQIFPLSVRHSYELVADVACWISILYIIVHLLYA